MDLSIFPDSMKLSKVSTEGLTLETIASSGEAAKSKYLLTLS